MEDEEARNRDAQRRLYGEPLAALLKRYADTLRLTQGRVAELLGVSAPMLSQLANGRRVRFGNPLAVQRLQAMDAAVREVAAGTLPLPTALERLERGRDSDVFTATRPTGDAAEVVRAVFAAAASPAEFAAAAEALEATHPAVADLLRTYGA